MDATVLTGPNSLTRTYKGSLAKATKAYSEDAEHLSTLGYVTVTSVYTQGSWGCWAFLLALLLFWTVVGTIVFIYMLIVKPAGTLLVTYHRA